MKHSFSNTSELTKLHHLSNFLGGRCPEFPYQARVVAKLFLFLYLYNIIYDIFKEKNYASILQNALS